MKPPTRQRTRLEPVVVALFVAAVACTSDPSADPPTTGAAGTPDPSAAPPTATAESTVAATGASESTAARQLALPAPRAVHHATKLATGQVLITGGCTLPGCDGAVAARQSVLFDPSKARFLPGPAMSTSRLSDTATRLADGRVLLTGGYPGEGGVVASSAELYDPAANQFESTGAMSQARADHSATLLSDGRVLIAGGWGTDGEALDSTELYDPASGSFSPGPSLSTPRAAHAAARVGDRLILVGGTHGDDALATTDVLDGGAWQPGPSLRTARVKHAAVSLDDGTVFVVGGATTVEGRELLDSTELLDPDRRRARPGPSLAEGQYKLTDAVVVLDDGRVAIAGGTRVSVYDPETGAMTTIERTSTPRRSFVSASEVADDKLLVAGGYDDQIVPSSAARLVPLG